MQLVSGSQLGPYQVVACIGVGGMGEVYRARDTRLQRYVALKLLRELSARNEAALERFEREARAASSLNHPNIVTIYDIGCIEGICYIAMEFIEGRTLRQILTQGSVPIRRAMSLAIQAAEGLAAAHDKGIVHRDLKPENLMVTQENLLKILDFGLAKCGIAALTQDESTISVATGAATGAGTILGTVGYMSPQQASGETVDYRSDQFSLGVILYELLTGKRAFHRSTSVETLAAIIQDEPEPASHFNLQISLPLDWTLKRCLAKHPRDRYFSSHDLAKDLAMEKDHLCETSPHARVSPSQTLPLQPTTLIGRDREVAAATQLLLDKDTRLVTMTGPGGIGKTRLALEVSAALQVHFTGGVYFVSLGSISDAALVASVIAQRVGAPPTPGQPAFEALRIRLRANHWPILIILDNFEQLLAAAPVVSELLMSCDVLKVLVTSRAVLHVYGEHEFPVPALGLPDSRRPPPLDTFPQYPSVALFLQRAAAVKPGYIIAGANLRIAAEVCSRLDGIPLAIELAAARVKMLTPAAMLARLQGGLQLLTGGPSDSPERQQTLRKTIDWSFNLLNTNEQKLFCRLSIFVGGWTLEGAEAVCNTRMDLGMEVFDGIASLVDKSLMQRVETTDEEARFRMMETIREYALERLLGCEDAVDTKRAHAAYFLLLAEEGHAQLPGPEHSAWLHRFDLDHDNFRAALEWLLATQNVEWSMRLGAGLYPFWSRQGHVAEGYQRLSAILKLPGPQARSKARARLLLAAGGLGIHCDPAQSWNEESLELFRELGDRQGILASLSNLAVESCHRGDYEGARWNYEDTLRICEELGEPMSIAGALSNLAGVLKIQGEYVRARSLYQECMLAMQRAGNRSGMAWSLNHQGDLAVADHDRTTAAALYREALSIFRELEDGEGIASSVTDLGNLMRDEGEYGNASELYREAIKLYGNLGHRQDVARLLANLAGCAAAQDMPERAVRLAGAAAVTLNLLGQSIAPAAKLRMESMLAPSRLRLSGAVAATAWAEGWAMALDQAIDYAVAAQ